VAVLGGLQFQSISPGSFHTCAVTAAGEAYCWGENEDGQLGVNSTTNASEPTLVSGGLTFASVDAGHAHTCGVTTDGDAYCWGSNKFGRLGSSSSASQSLSPTQVDDGTNYLQMSAGASYTCGLRSPADAWCWGMNQSGQLGAPSAQQCYDTNPDDPEAPPRVLACSLTPVRAVSSLDLTMISTSSQHTCGLASDQVLYCWGSGVRGQLGGGSSGSEVYSVEPVRVSRQP
jgi:alpha-tubulin suppressor-like RCC1 family protein